jgi:DNA processing protein
MSEAVDRLRLARSEGVGPVTYRRLLRRYGKAAAALEALPRLARAGGRAEAPAIPTAAAAKREIEKLQQLGGRSCSSTHPATRRCSRCSTTPRPPSRWSAIPRSS